MHGQKVTFGESKNPRESELSSVAIHERAQKIAHEVERNEMARGYKVTEARERIAKSVGVSPWLLWRLARNRLKTIPEGLTTKLHEANVRLLQQNLARATHEMEMAFQIGLRRDCPEMAKLEAAAEKARKLIEEAR